MGKNLVLALVACLIAIPAVAAETKTAQTPRQLAALTVKKPNTPKVSTSATKPAAPAETPSHDYQLERDGCCYGTTMGPWY
jgi:hypothetical protein